MHTVRFYSSIESKEISPVSYTPVANAETDILQVWSPDYQDQFPVSVGGNTQATLNIDFVKGSLTNAIIKVYGTPDKIDRVGGVRWFPVTVATYVAGVATLDDLAITLLATAKKSYEFGVGAWKGIKVTAASTGTVTSSTLGLVLSFRTN